MTRIKSHVVMLAVWAMAAAPAWSAFGSWSSSGPEGGPITAVVQSPLSSTTLYVGTRHDGVYKTSDGGSTWLGAGNGAPRAIAQLSIGPGGALYAIGASDEPGVFRSSDGGVTWSSVLAQPVTAVAIDPSTAGTAYAFVPDVGVFKTVDSGVNWSSSGAGLTDVVGTVFAIDPVTPLTVYLGSQASAVYKSTDGGVNWTKKDAGIEDLGVVTLFVDPVTPTTLYVAMSEGLFKTEDGADTWTPLTPPPTGIRSFILDPAVPATLWAGGLGRVFRSVDSGASWTEPSGALPPIGIDVVLVDRTSSSTVFLGTGTGTLKTTDSGSTWARIVVGIRAMLVDKIAIDPATPATLYALSPESGLFKSVDSGASWLPAEQGLSSLLLQDVSIAETQPQKLLVAQERDLRESVDGGGSWSDPVVDDSAFGLIGPVVGSLALAPVTVANVVATHSGPAFMGGGPGIYRSTDGAGSWSRVFDPGLSGIGPGEVEFNALMPAEVLNGLDGRQLGVLARQSVLLLSTDAGASWTEVHRQDGQGRVALGWDPFDSDTAYAVISPGAGFAALKSTDGGSTWSPFTVGAPCVNDLLPDPATTGRIWVGCDPVWVSENGGTSWAAFDATGFTPGGDGALTLEFAPGSAPTLHAGTLTGVFSYSFPSPADLSITKDDGESELDPGDPLTYTIVVSNLGPEDVVGATVTDLLPDKISCTWACLPSGGAACTATPPAGDLSELVDIPFGDSVTFTGICSVALDAAGFITNTATVAPPANRIDSIASNDTASDTDLVIETGACGVPNDRFLSGVDLDVPETIKACNSIVVDGVTISSDIVFRAPLISVEELAVTGTWSVFNEVPVP